MVCTYIGVFGVMALRFGVSGDWVVAGYVIVVDLNLVWPDSSVVRAFGMYISRRSWVQVPVWSLLYV